MTALLIIATGKYDKFIKHLLDSADRYFLPGEDVTYVLFTDKPIEYNFKRFMMMVPTDHRPWPYATLDRYEIFSQCPVLEGFEYLYYCDADMLFVDTVGKEIFGKRVATIHPGYVGGVGSPERNHLSTAYIPHLSKNVYYAGGFNGGSEYLKMCKALAKNIQIDKDNGVMAVWHDESHMNRYLFDNHPDVVLTPSYCYPESWDLPFPKKLLALDKDHEKIR